MHCLLLLNLKDHFKLIILLIIFTTSYSSFHILQLILTDFFCVNRLLSWAGKGIEPYGVDYILQKLGFAHARVTIPKWMQRGCMDPLDKILAVVMEKMIAAVKNDREESGATAYI